MRQREKKITNIMNETCDTILDYNSVIRVIHTDNKRIFKSNISQIVLTTWKWTN